MRIRRENGGKDIIVTCGLEVDKLADDLKSDELQLSELMDSYGVPLSVEMMSRLMRCVVKDLQGAKKDKVFYKFTLVAERVEDE